MSKEQIMADKVMGMLGKESQQATVSKDGAIKISLNKLSAKRIIKVALSQ